VQRQTGDGFGGEKLPPESDSISGLMNQSPIPLTLLGENFLRSTTSKSLQGGGASYPAAFWNGGSDDRYQP
jgi:hypothetical protein